MSTFDEMMADSQAQMQGEMLTLAQSIVDMAASQVANLGFTITVAAVDGVPKLTVIVPVAPAAAPQTSQPAVSQSVVQVEQTAH